MRTGGPSTRILGILIVACLLCGGCSRQEPPPSSSVKKETQGSHKEAGTSNPNAGPGQTGGRPGVQSATEPQSATESGPSSDMEEVGLDPASPVTGDSLKATIVPSSSGESGKEFLYRWKVDGLVVQESPSNVLARPIKRGDFVEVEVSAQKPGGTGKFVSRYATVGNAPPEVKLSSQNMGSDGKYEGHLEGKDPEQDSITFGLRNGPQGMTVDPYSGVIRWAAGPEVQGVFSVEVSAKDSQGAETALSFQIKVRRETVGRN